MNVSQLKELQAQRDALDAQIATIKKEARGAELEKIRTSISEFGFTPDELFGKQRKTGPGAGGTVAAKYRDPATGQTWTGRGKAPKWIEGKNREDYLIDKS